MKRYMPVFKIFCLCILLSLGGLRKSSFAESFRLGGSLSITALMGHQSGFTLGKLLPLPNTADVPDVTYELENKSLSWGMRLGYGLNEYLEIQGSFTYRGMDFIEDLGPGLAGVPLGRFKLDEADSFTISGNILWNFPAGRLQPYVTAGLGVGYLKFKKFHSATKPHLNFGAGLKFRFSHHLQAVADIRDFVNFFDFTQDFGISYIAIYTEHSLKNQHALGIHFGLSYIF